MKTGIFWFRRDLRVKDNLAFAEACKRFDAIIPLYIYDKDNSILGAAQQWWLYHSLIALNQSLEALNLKLILREGKAQDVLEQLLATHTHIEQIIWNKEYTPAALTRDHAIKQQCSKQSVEILEFNSCYLTEPESIKNKQGGYFKVQAPYWKHCLNVLTIPDRAKITKHPKQVPVKSDNLASWHLLPKHPDWAIAFTDFWQPGEQGASLKLTKFIKQHLMHYAEKRNFPMSDATSSLSPHLHFGEISPHAIIRAINKLEPEIKNNDSTASFLRELGWREFSSYLLFHYPSLEHKNYQERFDNFSWDNNKKFLKLWQQGRTGYPIVDAGMRQLWTTGYMHNRVRMITASFLVKDLLIDWQQGAAWFYDTLVDADLANNSVNWQWVAGSGIDAAQYTRVFNPILQSKRFDPDGEYIRQWVPELSSVAAPAIHEPWADLTATKIASREHYPKPIVDHQSAKIEAIARYHSTKR